MKKLISILLCLLLLLTAFSSCDKKEPSEKPTETTFFMDNLPEKLRLALEDCEEGEYEKASTGTMDHVCPPIEYYLSECTDVLKATYKLTKQVEMGRYAHLFEVIENVRGKGTTKTIAVLEHLDEMDGHSTYKISYKKENNYLLLLKRSFNVVNEGYGDAFMSIALYSGLTIPLDANGNPDIKNSSYCVSDVGSFSKDELLKKAISEGRFLEEILKRIENNPLVFTDIVEYNDISELVDKSDNIIEITVTYVYPREYIFGGVSCDCKITRRHKVTEKLSVRSNITLILPEYFAAEGLKFLVLLHSSSGRISDLQLSSFESIYYKSDEEGINKILAELE